MDRKLIDYLPDILKNILEFRQIMGAEQPELEAFWDKGNKLDVRNLRILAVMQGRLPYTYRTLYKSLLAMVNSERDFKLSVDVDKRSVSIVVALSSKDLKDEREKLAEKMVPANMTLEVLLWYTTHRLLEIKTHGELEQYTHEQMTELDLR